MKSDIDQAVRTAVSYEHFICQMRGNGYAVKGESLGEKSLKYLSFSAPGQNRFVRVSEKNFGKGYTKEIIKEKIESRTRRKEAFVCKSDAQNSLIDTSRENFQNSLGLQQWAKVQNLKVAAASYAAGGSMEDLRRNIARKTSSAGKARSELVALEHELKHKAEILKYAKQYSENRKYQKAYERAKDPDAYLQKHETELILFGGAETMLKRYGVKISGLDVTSMEEEYHALVSRKEKLKGIYKTAEKDATEAKRQLENVTQYMGMALEIESRDRKDKRQVQGER